MQYRAGAWTEHYRAAAGESLITAAPAGSKVIVLFESGVREYDPRAGTWKVLRDAANSTIGPFAGMSARAPDFWISGEKGLARLRASPGGDPEQWSEIRGADFGLSGFRFPVPGKDGELLAQAKAGAGRIAVVRWWRGNLEKLYSSDGAAPRGWRGPDGSLWVLEGSALNRLLNGRKIPVARDGVLTGNVFDMYSGTAARSGWRRARAWPGTRRCCGNLRPG